MISKVIQTMLPFVCAIFDMRKQALSNLSLVLKILNCWRLIQEVYCSMTTAVKKLRNMIFLPDALSQKLMHSAMDDVHVVFDIIRHSSSMLALRPQSTLSSLEAYCWTERKYKLIDAVNSFHCLGFEFKFSDDNDERRTKIRNLLEKRFFVFNRLPCSVFVIFSGTII